MERQSQRLMPGIVWFGLYLTAFYFANRYGLAFTQTAAVPVWFPGSVLLCALLCAPRRWWPVLLVAILPIRLWTTVSPPRPVWLLLATTAVDCGTAVLAALLLRRRLRNPLRFETLGQFGLYCLIAVFVAPAVGATFGALVMMGSGQSYWVTWEQWIWGNVSTHLLVTPFILYWVLSPPDRTIIPRASALRRLEAGLLLTGLPVVLWMVFEPAARGSTFGLTLMYAPIAFLIWAAARFGVRGISGAILLLALFAVRAALLRLGPFAGDSATFVAAHLQHFLLLPAGPLYLVGVMSDASRRSEQYLRDSERRFRDIADTAPVVIWTTDQDKNCRFVNKGWLDFTGRTLAQGLGLGWRLDVHPDDLDHVKGSIAAVDGRLPFELDYRLRRHDGEYRWIMTRGVPRYGTQGEFLGYIGSAIDVTERKRVEEAERQLHHAARLATLGELTAVVSHEINQPLFAILANTEAADILLQQDVPPIEEVRRILADISKDDLRASEVIRVVRPLTHKRTPNMGMINPNELVISIVRLVKADAARRRVEIRHELGANLPSVPGDESSLEQVILNLLINGMDAMRDTPPESARLITVTTELLGYGDVQIAVADRGQGIAPDHMPQLFDSFFTTKPDGMGLGLSTARQIVQSHKGRIWAVNNTAGGATFYVTLPSVAKQSDTGQSTNEAAPAELVVPAASLQRDWLGEERIRAH